MSDGDDTLLGVGVIEVDVQVGLRNAGGTLSIPISSGTLLRRPQGFLLNFAHDVGTMRQADTRKVDKKEEERKGGVMNER